MFGQVFGQVCCQVFGQVVGQVFGQVVEQVVGQVVGQVFGQASVYIVGCKCLLFRLLFVYKYFIDVIFQSVYFFKKPACI